MVVLTKKGGLLVETGRFFRPLPYLARVGERSSGRAVPRGVGERTGYWVLRRLKEAAQ